MLDAHLTYDIGGVFFWFACGGLSSMGYKLAGFDVIGCNEIDHRMMYAYCQNHNRGGPGRGPGRAGGGREGSIYRYFYKGGIPEYR